MEPLTNISTVITSAQSIILLYESISPSSGNAFGSVASFIACGFRNFVDWWLKSGTIIMAACA
jgi:hypothetical protein